MDKLPPIRSRKAYLQIVDTLVDRIARGELEYGNRLYNEGELMAMLGVSRPTLREALRVLEFLGIVTVAPRSGIRISSPQDDHRYLPLLYSMVFERISQRDLFELRQALQVEMAGHAADRRDEAGLTRLRAAARDMRDHMDADAAAFARLDYAFHMEILRCAGNFAAVKLMNTFGILIERQLRETIEEMPLPRRKKTLSYHEGIVLRIEQQDAAGARALMYEHLSRSREANSSEEPVRFRLDSDL